MSFISDFIADITGADKAGDAASAAAQTQANSAQLGIDELRRQFDRLQELQAPYAQAGTGSLKAQQDLAGLNGPQAQAAAIAQLEGSPAFTAMQRQGETAILQNASATGGLRGGNTQAALAEFRPAMLAQLIDQQYGRLGGITSLGQNAAAGTGNAGMQTGANVASLLQQQGAATAGGQLAQGGVRQAGFGNLVRIGGTAAALYGGFGGGAAATPTLQSSMTGFGGGF